VRCCHGGGSRRGLRSSTLALALAIIIAIDAGPLALTTTSASSVARGWPQRAAWKYALAVGAGSCLLLAAVWTDAFGNPLEFRPATWDATLDVLRALMVAPLLVAIRRYFHGRLIYATKTGWVVWATVGRPRRRSSSRRCSPCSSTPGRPASGSL
jgi:hypothetical protein